jgi:hypothetical protein
VGVTFGTFRKTYLIDAVVNGAAVFEFKAVDGLTPRHNAQLLHYLLLADLPRGYLVNLRSELVQHKFLGTSLRPNLRKNFRCLQRDWQEFGMVAIRPWLTEFLFEIGTSLVVELYEEALTHLLGGESNVLRHVDVLSNGDTIGAQQFKTVVPDVAFRITTMDNPQSFESHAARILSHTRLRAIQWININREEVWFTTITK